MPKAWIFGALVLALLAIGAIVVGWLMWKRPLDVWDWVTRRALTKAGLKKQIVSSPAGAQVVFVGGSGPMLVFLHGAGHQAGTWLQAAKRLLTRYTLVIPDLAGHGESEPRVGSIQTSAIVQALEAVIPSLAQGRQVTLVGNSLGAWMAMVLANRHPEWIERVVAVNGGPLKGTNPEVRLLTTTRDEARRTMSQLRDASSPAIPDPMLDDLVRRSKVGSLARFAATEATMEAWTLSEEQLQEIKVPVRLLWGVADGFMPLDYAKRMQAVLPDVELIPIDRCGHVPQVEAPERFLAVLEKALGASPQTTGEAR